MALIEKRIHNSKKTGISLLEMLVSLGIFAVIVLPMVSLPLKAKDQNTQSINTAQLSSKLAEVLNNSLANDINRALRFFPLSGCIRQETSLSCQAFTSTGITGTYTVSESNHLLVGYPSTNRTEDMHIAYRIVPVKRIKDIGDSTEGNKIGRTPPLETIYQIQRINIDDNTQLQNLVQSSTDSKWIPLGGKSGGKTLNFSNIKFVYMLNGKCKPSDDYLPIEADGVSITNNLATCNPSGNIINGDFTVTVGNVTKSQGPVYFRLASLQADIDKLNKVYAFPAILKNYGNLNITGAPTSVTSNKLDRDIGYDYRTGELLIATDDQQASRKFYINKCKPEVGCSNYTFSPSDTAATTDNQAKYFPVVLDSTSAPGYPGPAYTFRSITQDRDSNLYVLATNGTYAKILKFTENGTYQNTFYVHPDVKALTFDPNTPDEILAMIQYDNFDTYVVSYLTDPPNDAVLGTQVKWTALSPRIGAITSAVGGFDIDPYSNRFLFALYNSSSIIAVPHSIYANADINSLTNSRVLSIGRIQDSQNLLGLSAGFNVTGLAFDPINNRFFATLPRNEMISIGNSIRLERNYQ